MLTSETKRKIDSLRDTFVGTLPEPTKQIEQITLALIYKFMSDIDEKNVAELHSKSFFNDHYRKYAWRNIMDHSLSAPDRLALYKEGLEKMSLNPHLPQLFRDIFKGAFLPFNNPEVLSMFLKGINEFNYDHSEELGNAFEYLLSVMGSQGDAGQFRTPRHIIDFIVAVVEPQKGDAILDPACGTAGFLISAYKHILNKNVDASGKPGSALTMQEREKLSKNIVGYDISHDMVRLSLANMYLHGLREPRIYEYDTLTSQDRWDDMFDCILANPPFMSPRGGIRPHNRFGIQANRSEVLFVDYIMEHLTPQGRAGIIVPEGIIFQSGNAYKALRKALVEGGYLWAVISLPAGVFNPYSGVKCSILLLDRTLASKSEDILFVKINNDGRGLGTQRRKINENDLPTAESVLRGYKTHIASGDTDIAREWIASAPLASLVEKSALVGSDFNLSSDRYRVAKENANAKWPMVKIGDICVLEYGKPLKEVDRKGGEYPVFGSNGIVGWHDEYLVMGPLIVVGRKGTAGAVTYSEQSGYPIDTTFYVRLLDASKVDLKYLYYLLKQAGLDRVNTQAGVPGLNRNDAYKIKIPLPPIEVQQQIVATIVAEESEIEKLTAAADARREAIQSRVTEIWGE